MPARLICMALMMVMVGGQTSGFPAAQAGTSTAQQDRDGQHDWDTFFGTWKMHLKRRLRPLTGSNEWQEFESHDTTRKVWGGRANLDELEADGPSGHIEGLTVRLYNPHSHQWSIYWANASAPTLDIATIGRFNNGRGEFYDQEMFHERAIFVRYLWTNVSDKSGDFEQSFSDDGGKAWEPNWLTTMERETPSEANVPPNPDNHDGQHDFDFEFGRWKVHLNRLTHPLSGAKEWKQYDGSVIVSKVWNGRANIAEFEGATGSDQIVGLSVRLFDPHTRQWSLWWANAADGVLDRVPAVGGFENGRGEFFSLQQVAGRWVLVRLVFSGITAHSLHGEQSYSSDGGRTWQPNWIEDLTREPE
jgi:hypothetical protein